MLQTLLDGYRTITDIDTFTLLVLAGLVVSSYALIKISTDSLLLASLFTPFMAFGGLVAKYYFDANFVNLLNDKDANTVFALSCGVLAAMLVMTLVARSFGAFSDWRSRRKRPGRRVVAAE